MMPYVCQMYTSVEAMFERNTGNNSVEGASERSCEEEV